MATTDFSTSTWSDIWFRNLTATAKLLFLYLWTNDHKNLPCLYQLDVSTISFETGLKEKDILIAFESLKPKILYDNEAAMVWVVNFVRHQFVRNSVSPKIIKGIESALIKLNGHAFVGMFLEHYKFLNIQYQYPINSLSIESIEGYPYSPSSGKGVSVHSEVSHEEKSNNKQKKYFGKYNIVFMTDEEHQKLITQYGEEIINSFIERLGLYIGSKGVKYKDHYLTILNWIRKENDRLNTIKLPINPNKKPELVI